MTRTLLSVALSVIASILHAQPDSLFVPSAQGVTVYAIAYAPIEQTEQFTRVGRFATDTSRIAVRLDYKRGKPCGVYRAFYPDGRPLIFAVYGWGWPHGDWTEYGPDGRITVKGQYDRGQRDGTWAFRAEGIIGHYKHGKKHGKWKYYENDRVVRVERYRDDRLVTGGRNPFK